MPNQIVFTGITGTNAPALQWKTQAASTAIPQGWPVLLSGNYAIIASDATPVVGTDVLLGVSNGESTQTASDDGVVDVFMPLEGIIMMLPAKTPANIATQAQYDALVGHHTLFDITAGVLTIDESANSANNGLVIVPNDISANPGMVKFIARNSGTFFA